MKHAFFLAPAGTGAGLTTVSLGLVNALDRRGVRVAFFKPISQRTDSASGLERSTHFIRATTMLLPADPIPVTTATRMISEGRLDELLGQVIVAFNNSTEAADIVVIEGLRSGRGDPQLGSLNHELVKTLSAQVILVASSADKTTDQLEYSAKVFGGVEKLLGIIVNHYPIRDDATLTGNATYKAVQRSANVLSIGPMLQGLRRPVNDLSRGALVDDIVYIIALTAIQATQG